MLRAYVLGGRFQTSLSLLCVCVANPFLFSIPSAVLVVVFHRHNELCNLISDLLSEVCSNVSIEPPLQPLNNEPLCLATAKWEDGARLTL